jgi:iron(III) transport system permease protein
MTATLPDHASPAAARGPLARRRARNLAGRNAPILITGGLIALLVLPPIAAVIYSSFVSGDDLFSAPDTLEHYRTVLQTSHLGALLRNTFVLAAGVAVLSVILATATAFLVERTDAPFRRFVYFAVVICFGLPTIIQVMGWILLIGPNASLVNSLLESIFGDGAPAINAFSLPAMIFVQSLIIFPALFLLIAPALRMSDPALEHAAEISGASRWRVLRTITLPLATPAILAAALLAFILTIEAFEVPALLGTPGGVRVLSTAIYASVNDIFPDYGAASAMSTLLMLLTIAGVFVYQRVTARSQRFATMSGKGYRPERMRLRGRARWGAGAVTLIVPLLTLAPIGMLAWTSLVPSFGRPSLSQIGEMDISNYSALFDTPAFLDSLRRSVLLGAVAAIVVMLMTLVASWSVIRRRNPLSRGIDQLATLPLVVPGVVLSLALVRLFVDFPLRIYGTSAIILLAFVVHYVPYGLRYNQAGLVALHAELEEAADVSGASRLQVFRHMLVPLLRPTLIAGGLFVFLASLRQLALVVFLAGPNTDVVSMTMFNLWTLGSISNAAAAAMVVSLLVLILAVGLYRVTGLGRDADAGASLEVR